MGDAFLSQLSFSEILSEAGQGVGISVVLGVALLFLIEKLGLLKRENRILRILTLLYFLYVPLLFGAFGALWCINASAERQTVAAYDSIRGGVTRYSVKLTEWLWTKIERDYPEGQISIETLVKTTVARYVGDKVSEFSWAGTKLPSFLQGATSQIAAIFKISLLLDIEETLLKSAAGARHVDVEALRTIWKGDLVAAMENGLVMKSFEGHITRPYRQARTTLLWFGAALLAPVLIEIILSVFLRRRRSKQSLHKN